MTHRSPLARYLNVSSIHGVRFAPDGKSLVFLSNSTGISQVWEVSLSPKASPPAQRTFHEDRIVSAHYSPAQLVLLLEGDQGGNEQYQLFQLISQEAVCRPLIDAPEIRHHFGAWSPDGTHIAFSSNRRDKRYLDVYEMEINTYSSQLVYQQDGTNYVRSYSPDGQYLLLSTYFSSTRNSLVLLQRGTGKTRLLTPESHTNKAFVARYTYPFWSTDHQSLFVLSNQDRQFFSLASLDIATTTFTYLYEPGWDIEEMALTRDGARMALSINEEGYSRLEIYDLSAGWDQREHLEGPAFPRGVISDLAWSPDGTTLAATIETATAAPAIWVWHAEKRRTQLIAQQIANSLDQVTTSAPSLVRYPTFDGREIPAFLYLPRGASRDLPFIIHIHGGPAAQARPVFHPIIQYLVSCGYGVLAPNVRGSTGYGVAYQRLDDVYQRMDAVKDLYYAALWLKQNGYAHSRRLAAMGGSYGGFMVLAALATYPETWAAGVVTVGISNFVTFLQNTGPWRRAQREVEYGSLERDRAFLKSISPIYHVDKISAPLFVIHGANDPRVPVGEAEQIVAALHKRNVPVEYLLFQNEGHGLKKRENQLKAYPAVVEFLSTYV